MALVIDSPPPSAQRTSRIRASVINIYPVLCRAAEEQRQWQMKLSKLLLNELRNSEFFPMENISLVYKDSL